MTCRKGVRVAKCTIGQEYCYPPSISVRVTDAASEASVVGRYQNSRREGGNMNHLGTIIKQQRTAMRLTLRELATASGLSASHLGRIERGERFPSAYILRRIAKPLGFDEVELLTLAGFLSPIPTEDAKEKSGEAVPQLDPYVAKVLAEEPLGVQRSVIGVLAILKRLAKNIGREDVRQ